MELVINSVSKQYRGNVWALRDFSLRLGPGIVGLLGPTTAAASSWALPKLSRCRPFFLTGDLFFQFVNPL